MTVRQIVVLAAGMDSRTFRLELPTELALFEVDRPDRDGSHAPRSYLIVAHEVRRLPKVEITAAAAQALSRR